MNSQRLAALCALATVAAAQSLVQTIETDFTTNESAVYRVYLGYGRNASVTPTISGSYSCGTVSTDAASNVAVTLAYAEANTTASGTICIPLARNSSDCVGISNSTNATGDFTQSSAATYGDTLVFRSVGGATFHYFAEYTVDFPCTAASGSLTFTLSWTSTITNPADGFCVREQDSTVVSSGEDAPSPDYFATGADLPREANNQFVLETRYVPGPNAISPSPTFCTARASCSTTADCGEGGFCLNGCCRNGTDTYFDLGLGPQIELSCLNVFPSPAAADVAGCDSSDYSVSVVDVVACNGFSSLLLSPYNACCTFTSEEQCNLYEANATSQTCKWMSGTCHPTIGMNEVDLSSSGIINVDKQTTYSFSASKMNGPRTDYVQVDDQIFDPASNNVGNRRWYLKYTQMQLASDPTAAACNEFVTFSFKSATTGGLCEPSARNFCDGLMESCMRTDPLEYPRFWRWSDAAATVRADYVGDEYKTCNCLKQKEVCYRKNGCVSTKRYQLILMNCLDQGCGNWCEP